MTRFCRATNGWRNKRLCDAWKAEHRPRRRHKKAMQTRYKKAKKCMQFKWVVVRHETGHKFMYNNGGPESATIRIQTEGPNTDCPWPGFSNWSDLTRREATKQ